jgi:hypothetical protein
LKIGLSKARETMKIRKEIKIKERRMPFGQWLLFSPSAFTITFRMALILPPILMTLLLIYGLTLGSVVLCVTAILFLALTIYNVWKNRSWFKLIPESTIARTIWKIKDEEEKDG